MYWQTYFSPTLFRVISLKDEFFELYWIGFWKEKLKCLLLRGMWKTLALEISFEGNRSGGRGNNSRWTNFRFLCVVVAQQTREREREKNLYGLSGFAWGKSVDGEAAGLEAVKAASGIKWWSYLIDWPILLCNTRQFYFPLLALFCHKGRRPFP